MKALPESRETREHLAKVMIWLSEMGWEKSHNGQMLTHPKLCAPWPLSDAVRLQAEADSGCMDVACRILRGEV